MRGLPVAALKTAILLREKLRGGGAASRRLSGSVGRRPLAAPVAHGPRQVTRHAARARRARGLLRGSARRAALRAPRPAQHHPPTRPTMLRGPRPPNLETSRGCPNFGHRPPRRRLLPRPHVSLHRCLHRLRPIHGSHRSYHFQRERGARTTQR